MGITIASDYCMLYACQEVLGSRSGAYVHTLSHLMLPINAVRQEWLLPSFFSDDETEV